MDDDQIMQYFKNFVVNSWCRPTGELSRQCYVMGNETLYPRWLELQTRGLVEIESSYVNVYNMMVTLTDLGFELGQTFLSMERL